VQGRHPAHGHVGLADRLAAAAIAAGGTLGSLIPPSGALVVAGISTQTDIAVLFVAGGRHRRGANVGGSAPSR
jgi:TRAP-type C4-dicarboxylate transport system permease large subunit